jgi:hypothetical protein
LPIAGMVYAKYENALEQAVAGALAAITPQNASAWFAHCGYGLC